MSLLSGPSAPVSLLPQRRAPALRLALGLLAGPAEVVARRGEQDREVEQAGDGEPTGTRAVRVAQAEGAGDQPEPEHGVVGGQLVFAQSLGFVEHRQAAVQGPRPRLEVDGDSGHADPGTEGGEAPRHLALTQGGGEHQREVSAPEGVGAAPAQERLEDEPNPGAGLEGVVGEQAERRAGCGKASESHLVQPSWVWPGGCQARNSRWRARTPPSAGVAWRAITKHASDGGRRMTTSGPRPCPCVPSSTSPPRTSACTRSPAACAMPQQVGRRSRSRPRRCCVRCCWRRCSRTTAVSPIARPSWSPPTTAPPATSPPTCAPTWRRAGYASTPRAGPASPHT